MSSRGTAPNIRRMQASFVMVHLYGNKPDNKWSISDFCKHFECTEEEVKAQFCKLWENEKDFSARWKQLAKNSKKKGGKEMADAEKSDSTKVEETNVAVAEEKVEEEQVAPSLTPPCVRTPKSYDQELKEIRTEIEEYEKDCVALSNQIKPLMEELLEKAHRGVDLTAKYRALEKEKSTIIVFHVRKNGYVDVPVGVDIKWDWGAVDDIMCNDLGEWLAGFEYAGADRSCITSVKKTVARCFFMEDMCTENGKHAKFEFGNNDNDLSKRAYQYARAIRARLVADASETAS